jgi:hypothetical protein
MLSKTIRFNHASHDGHNPRCDFGYPVPHPTNIQKKLRHEEQIFWRIPTHGQFWKDNHIGFGFPRLANPTANGAGIPLKIPNHRINLHHR